MLDVVSKALLAGLGAQERAKEFVEELVKKGELSQSDAAKLMNEMIAKAEKSGEEIDKKIGVIVEKTLDKLNLPGKRDVERLETIIQELSNLVKNLEESR